MPKLTDCPSCGGLLPEDRNCCPHCHCKYSGVKRWRLAAAAVLSVGAASCDSSALKPGGDGGVPPDQSVTSPDMTGETYIDYGPAMNFNDLSHNDDGGTQ
jgi:hypothetical protein